MIILRMILLPLGIFVLFETYVVLAHGFNAHRFLGRVLSPDKKLALTVWDEDPSIFLSDMPSVTHFHLGPNNSFMRLFPGARRLVGQDVLRINGPNFPYGIQWRTNKRLHIRLIFDLESEYDYLGASFRFGLKYQVQRGLVHISYAKFDGEERLGEILIKLKEEELVSTSAE